MSSTRPRADRREQILDAAVALVREGGLAAASVRAVATRAGIGASTLRYWFPSQRALNEAVAARLLDIQIDDRRIGEPDVDSVERLVECLGQLLGSDQGSGQDGDDDRAALLGWLDLTHAAITRGAESLHAQLLAGFVEAGRSRVVAWLGQLATEGHLAADDVERAATALTTRIDGLALARLAPVAPLSSQEAHAILRGDVEHLLGG